MATFSKKMGGKEVGQANIYAKPHGEAAKQHKMTDPNNISASQTRVGGGVKRVSAGDPAVNDVKTSGIKIRGTGAATKGTMARGPMA
jgi:hypothetical protein